MKAIIGLSLSLALTGAALAQTNGNQAALPLRGVAKSTLQILNQRHPDINFQEAPLDQVVSFLTDITKLNVVVRWQQLEANSVPRDKPITLSLKNIRLSQILHEVMNQAGGSDVKLAYRASGNLLVLSTAEDLGKELLTKVYDVTDLLTRVPNFIRAPHIDLSSQQSGGGQGGGGGQNIFQGGGGGGGGGSGNEDSDEPTQTQNTGGTGQVDPRTQRLIDLITQTVEPESWSVNEGKGTINAFNRQLVVRNNILVHQALGGAIQEE